MVHVIDVRNVAQALPAGLAHLQEHGRWEETRAGRALVAPAPVATVYSHPRERVLFSAARDANPFFHLAESVLWMLAGRRDAAFLDRFVGDFGARFAEPDGTVHGAYGHRWRHMFAVDQLDAVVQQLSEAPGSRQAVLQMWDATHYLDGSGNEMAGGDDLAGVWRDRPCNTHAYLRINRGPVDHTGDHTEDVLDIAVLCRSNDVVFGAYGANAVQFSVLQEYLAARLDVGVGTYTQFSFNFHAYEDQVNKLARSKPGGAPSELLFGHLFDDCYSTQALAPQPLVHDAESFDEEVLALLKLYEGLGERGGRLAPAHELSTVHEEVAQLHNKFLSETVWPALMAHRHRRNGAWWRRWAERIASPDWRIACAEWLERREAKRKSRGAA